MAAYHETHDAPHCPTCDCGVESLSRQGGDSRCPHCDDTGDVHTADGEWHGVCSCPAGDKIGKDAPPKTRASEAGDWVLVPTECTHIMEYTLSEALASGDYSIGECLNRAIAAAPAPGGEL